MAPKVKLLYTVGDMVVCKHKDTPYDGKIIDIKNIDSPDPIYVVHYTGWNSRYDEDVPHSKVPSKMLDPNDEAVIKARAATKENKKKKTRVENMDDELRKSENGSRGSSPGGTGLKNRTGKRKATDSPSSVADKNSVETNLNLPHALRQILVDDNDLISKNYLVVLPAAFTVDTIIKDYTDSLGISDEEVSKFKDMYVEYEESNSTVQSTGLALSAMALCDYFNTLLNYQLMYKFERPQYQELIEKEKASGEKPKKQRRSVAAADVSEEEFRPSKYYGLPHLLRLLSRLGNILKLSQWGDHLLTGIVKSLHDFVVWLGKNREKYFVISRDYKCASPEYSRLSHQS